MKGVLKFIIALVVCTCFLSWGIVINKGLTEFEKMELVNSMLVDAAEHFGDLENTQAGEAVSVCIHSVLTYGGEGE